MPESVVERLRNELNYDGSQHWEIVSVEAADVRALLAAAQALQRLVADLETNSEAGAPDYAHDALAIYRTEEPSDDEGLEPIETSPLTEREPDL